MKKIIVTVLSCGLITAVASAETSVSLDIASAYVFRGATVVDDLVVQPGIEVSGFGMDEAHGSVALGVWGSTAPFWDTYDNLHETDWYAVYTLPELVTNLNLSVGLTEYMYAGGAGENEINIAAAYALGEALTLGGSLNFMVDDEVNATEDQVYADLYADYAMNLSEKMDASFGGLVGFMSQGDGNDAAGLDDGLNQYELSAELSYALNEKCSLGGSLTYIGQIDDDVLVNAVYDRGLVAMFGVSCDM